MRILFGVLVALIAMPAGAHCSSLEYRVSAERIRASAVATVFVSEGHYVTTRADNDPDVVRFTVDVLGQWKGALPSQIVIESENSTGRFPMEIGQTYVVFLHRVGDAWSVDNCGNSSVLDPESNLMRALGPPRGD